MRYLFLLILLTSSNLAAETTPPPSTKEALPFSFPDFTPEQIVDGFYKRTEVKVDEFSRKKTVTHGGIAALNQIAVISFSESPTQDRQFHIIAVTRLDDRIYPHTCWLIGGVNLNCSKNDSAYQDRKFLESVIFKTSEADLRGYAKDGLRFKVEGTRGESIFELENLRFQGFLKRYDEFIATGK